MKVAIAWGLVGGIYVVLLIFGVLGLGDQARQYNAYGQEQSNCGEGVPEWCMRVDEQTREYVISQCAAGQQHRFSNIEPAYVKLAELNGKSGQAEVEACATDANSGMSMSLNQCAATSDGLLRVKLPTELCRQ